MNFFNFQLEIDRDFILHLLLVLCAIAIILRSSDAAFAAIAPDENDVVGQTLCRLVKNLEGCIAKGIATIAIFAVGGWSFLRKIKLRYCRCYEGVGYNFCSTKIGSFPKW